MNKTELIEQIAASADISKAAATRALDAVIDAVHAGDLKRLRGKHSGLYSVQLQPPMPDGPEPEPVEPPDGPDDETPAEGGAA